MNRTLTLFIVFALIIAMLPLGIASAQPAALVVEPSSGTVGSTVTVKGKGFTGSLATIYYDKSIVASKIRISETGEFTATFGVPESPRGNHQIRAVDNTQPKGSLAETSFKVIPKIWVQPNVVRLGGSVTTMGSGFSQFESGIRVTLDGEEVSPSINADFFGNWGVTFSVSNVSKGDHVINALGESIGIGEIANVTLIIGPLMKMIPEKGPVGTAVQFNGFSFNPSEDGVTITFDGEPIIYNAVANPDGSWEIKDNIPASTSGIHEIGAYGTYTSAAAVPKLKFEIIPEVKVTPDSGKVGEKIRVNGTGFGTEQTIELNLGKIEIGKVTSDTFGSFEGVFQIPQADGGMNEVNAVDGLGNSAQANLNLISVEETLPSIPEVLSPKGGSQLRIFPSALAAVAGFAKNSKTLIPKIFSSPTALKFDWSDVADPSGVSYAFQIAKVSEFSSLLIDKEGLTSSEYTLSETEALPAGDYYWRVRTVDGVGNIGPWAEVQKIQVSLMTTRSLMILVISVVVIVALVLFLILFWRARRTYYL